MQFPLYAIAPAIARIAVCLLCAVAALHAQTPDSTKTVEEEEDFSQYENLTFADTKAKNYCTPKIPGLSPQKLISIAYDLQLPAELSTPLPPAESRRMTAHGIRLGANIPVISNNKIVWQMGANYWETRYNTTGNQAESPNAFTRTLTERGLRTMGLNTTLFKPLNDKRFLLVQASADLNGDFRWNDFQSLSYLRYSAAAVFGFKPNDRLMWGLGAARTYRVGELNYIPVVLYNWSSTNSKWGTEILFPARGHVRRNFSPRTILMGGWELEGNTYRLNQLSNSNYPDAELRRGEARLRLVLERQLRGFIWLTAQAGWRYNWGFNIDQGDFFRGFNGKQPYLAENTWSNPLYFNIGVHLVSP